MAITQSTKLLNILHRGGGWAYRWTDKTKQSLWYKVGGEPKHIPQNINMYFGVHPTDKNMGADKRAGNEDITVINCLYADFDDDKLGGTKARKTHTAKLGVPPSARVESGGGEHCYWFLDKPYRIDHDISRKDAAEVQERWISYVGADVAVHDLGRILRLPGSMNVKSVYPEPMPCTLTYLDENAVYPLNSLVALLPSPKVGEQGDKQHWKQIEDMRKFLGGAGVRVKRIKELKKSKLYVLDSCPFPDAHTDGSFGFIRMDDGRTVPECKHNTCSQLSWEDVRNEFKIKQQIEEQDTLVPRFNWISATDCMEEPPEIEWLIEGLTAKGQLTEIYGKYGAKKSLATMDLGICVALGKQWIGKNTKQGTVLLVDEENGPNMMWRRMNYNMRGHNVQPGLPMYHATLSQLNILEDKDIDNLRQAIIQFDASLLILDVLAAIVPGADENSVSEMAPPMYALKNLASDTDCAIIIIHHAGKSGDTRGSTAIPGAMDNAIKITGDPFKDDIQFEAHKIREGSAHKFAAFTVFGENEFLLEETEIISGAAYVKIINQIIIEQIQDQDPYDKKSQGQIVKMTKRLWDANDGEEPGKNKITECLDAMVGNDLLAMTKHGVRNTYSVTVDGGQYYDKIKNDTT